MLYDIKHRGQFGSGIYKYAIEPRKSFSAVTVGFIYSGLKTVYQLCISEFMFSITFH